MLTRRQQIIALLSQHPYTVRQLGEALGLPMRDVIDDLAHISRSLGNRLEVSPSTCEACGRSVTRTRRFTAPSRCPRCKSERTTAPLITARPKK